MIAQVGRDKAEPQAPLGISAVRMAFPMDLAWRFKLLAEFPVRCRNVFRRLPVVMQHAIERTAAGSSSRGFNASARR